LCGHKGVFPVFPFEIGGIFLLAIMIGFSNIAGIGDGSVSTAYLMAMFKFPTKAAIAISSFKMLLTTTIRFV
jgi:uncharacterized membrane protein YfcA